MTAIDQKLSEARYNQYTNEYRRTISCDLKDFRLLPKNSDVHFIVINLWVTYLHTRCVVFVFVIRLHSTVICTEFVHHFVHIKAKRDMFLKMYKMIYDETNVHATFLNSQVIKLGSPTLKSILTGKEETVIQGVPKVIVQRFGRIARPVII